MDEEPRGEPRTDTETQAAQIPQSDHDPCPQKAHPINPDPQEKIEKLETTIKIDQWIMIALTGAIALAGFLQYCAISGQLEEMRAAGKQTDKLICEAIKQSKASRDSADAATSAAHTAATQEASWEVSQRPWIDVSDPSIIQQQTIPPITPIVPTQPMLQDALYSFEITVKAYGNTPALHGYAKMNPKFVELPQAVYPFLRNVTAPTLDSCSKSAVWEDGPSVFFPGGSYPILSNGQVTDIKDMRKMIDVREALFWVGCVRYEDAFARRYQSNFCFYWSATESPRGWYRCLTGNELIEFPEKNTP